ncbi:uncharacterized protein LOC126840676 [Adelges cooleyi]|uniref:uncharacterized protein LOC126840676 n=1 Tax=Adelges cooleyi TaxID=133065 RepID=UPI00217F2459|nr:uncharacterized protein LOC126840676 [Adelges cooleyi]
MPSQFTVDILPSLDRDLINLKPLLNTSCYLTILYFFRLYQYSCVRSTPPLPELTTENALESSFPVITNPNKMVLSDVNNLGGTKKSAAERWLRQRNAQRASAARCIFGPPEKRAHLMMIMRNEAEMERKRIEFASRYEPVGLTAAERRTFYDGLLRSPPHNNVADNLKNKKSDQQHKKCNNHNQPEDDGRNQK